MGIFENIKRLISKPKRRVLCPYCMGEIDTDEDHLNFACSRHPDEKIEKSAGKKRPVCPKCLQYGANEFFATADSIRCNAKKPEGADKCDKLIPNIMLDPEYTVYRIALVGTTSSGKTYFKSRLKSEIDKHFSSGYFEYPHFDIQPLEVGKELPHATDETDSKLFERPDFIGFSIKKYENGKTRERKILLVIYDFAGEKVSEYHKDEHHKISRKYQKIMVTSDAVFFLIDPEQNFNTHLGNTNWNQGNQLGNAQVNMSGVIQNVLTDINMLANQQQQVNPNEPIRTPKLAYIFSKADKDIVKNALKQENDNLLAQNPPPDRRELLWDVYGNPIYTNYDQWYIMNPIQILRNFVAKNDAAYSNYINFINQPLFLKPEDVRFFVCSALGMDSRIGKIRKVINGQETEIDVLTNIGPAFRVLDPLYWLLYDGK